MPNARLRQLYMAMMQARAFARSVPTLRGERSTLGLEACLVSPTVDLGPGDLVSDVLTGDAMDFLRGRLPPDRKKRKLTANCGQAGLLPGAVGSIERIWTAVGAAAALQSLAAHNVPNSQPGVTVVYLLPRELPQAFLKKIFILAREKRLPLIFVMLPATTAIIDAKTGRISELALACRVPAIPTDAADAVAIYRVAQESIGHARIGGGPAVVECVHFAMAGKRPARLDAIAGLEQYMLPRKVVTQAWLNREMKAFAKRLATAFSRPYVPQR